MTAVGFGASAVILPVCLLLYTYVGYPILLGVVGALRRRRLRTPEDVEAWPTVSISVPAYNEEAQIRELILSLLALEYPEDKLQILIVSDASSDRTDEIVAEYAEQGIELLRMPERGGKTRAENAAAEHLRGDVIVNTDASIRIEPGALKPLIAALDDAGVGCASGRDVSVGPGEAGSNAGESGYVGYEMWVRDLETRAGGIIGASGCFYAIRPELHRLPLPGELSRDFAAALHAEEHGFDAVSVSDALCYVPRTTALRREYRRKVRTITRGIETLRHKRALLNPFGHGLFAWKLLSHKVCRWLLPWGSLVAMAGLVVLAVAGILLALALLAVVGVVLVLAGAGWLRDGRGGLPRWLSVPAFVVAGNVAAGHALVRALTGSKDALWEPTRRHVVKAG